MFAPDTEVDELEALPTESPDELTVYLRFKTRYMDTPRWARALELDEEIRQFAAFCESLDPKDPLFWQRVFTEAGLPYHPVEIYG